MPANDDAGASPDVCAESGGAHTPPDIAFVDTLGSDPNSGAIGDDEDWLRELAAAPPVAGRLHAGVVVDDSYEVERELGRGGMGVVYQARDVQLERPVALKMLIGTATGPRLSRFQREARTMARLTHPNVLTVYEVGRFRGQLYIAMEYAGSGTARAWVKGLRGWRDKISFWVQAGRGLAAAHRVGVVHRDFKPDNVLIGDDGRPQVADFGLARVQFDATQGDGHGRPEGKLRDAELTATGAAMGTPLYMSPEQFAGLDVDARTDQFAFCVVLYECLFGQHPFSGNTVSALAEAVCSGEVRAIPGRSDVPSALSRIVLRGLRADVGERFSSMDELLGAIERVVQSRRRAVLGAVGVGVLVSLGAALLGAKLAAPQLCEDSGTEIAQTWNETRRAGIEQALHSSGVDASELLARMARMDRYAAAWSRKRREVCEATHVSGEQAEFALQLRNACLDRSRARFDALLTELGSGNVGEATGGHDREWSLDQVLPDVAECDDLDALEHLGNRLSSVSAHEEPARHAAYMEAIALVTRADLQMRAGRADAEALAKQALELARTHELPELEAQALRIQADLARIAGDGKRADELYAEAGAKFVAAGYVWGAAEQMVHRALAALSEHDEDAARIHLDYAEDFIDRIEDEELARRAELLWDLAAARLALYDNEPSRTIELLEPMLALDPPPEVVTLHRIEVLDHLGLAHFERGEEPEAAARFEEAIALSKGRGVERGLLAGRLNNLGLVQLALGETPKAVQTLRAAIAQAERDEMPEYVVRFRGNLGFAQRIAGMYEQARALQRDVLQDKEERFGPDHYVLAFTLMELADLAREAGDYDEALEHLNRAGRIIDAAKGPGHPDVADTLMRMGRVFLDKGEPQSAAGALRVALDVYSKTESDPANRGEVEYLLARATWGTPEATQHLREAVTNLRDATGPQAAVREEMQQWQAQQR